MLTTEPVRIIEGQDWTLLNSSCLVWFIAGYNCAKLARSEPLRIREGQNCTLLNSSCLLVPKGRKLASYDQI